MIKFSIIIPVYNTAKYLEKCITSLLSQNFKNFEIICIDDGSEDNSIEILKQYQNLKILKEKNSGSGFARNRGLEIAKGEYILFVDSDDWADKKYLDKINDSLKNNPDILIFGALTYDDGILRKGSYSINKIPKKYFNKSFNKNDFQNEIFKFPPTAWTKAYKKEFLIKNDIKFQHIKIGQDQIFFIKSMLLADKINILNENIYCYQKKRKGSVTSVKEKTDFSPVNVFFEVQKFTNERIILDKYFLKAAFWLSKMRKDLKKEYFFEFKKVLNYMKENYKKDYYPFFHPECFDSYCLLKLKYITAIIKSKTFQFLNKMLTS